MPANYIEEHFKLDDGETESVACVLREGDPYRLCSSDAIVFKVCQT
jgi:hypothetical protein